MSIWNRKLAFWFAALIFVTGPKFGAGAERPGSEPYQF